MVASLQNKFSNYRTRSLRIDIEENIITEAFPSLRFDTLAIRTTINIANGSYTVHFGSCSHNRLWGCSTAISSIYMLQPCLPSTFLSLFLFLPIIFLPFFCDIADAVFLPWSITMLNFIHLHICLHSSCDEFPYICILLSKLYTHLVGSEKNMWYLSLLSVYKWIWFNKNPKWQNVKGVKKEIV